MTARKGTFGSKPPGFLGRIASPLLWPLTLRGWSRFSPGLGSWPKRGRGLLATLRNRGLRKVRSRKRAGAVIDPGSFYASEFPRIEFAGNSSLCIKTASALGHHYHHRLPAPTLHFSSPKNGIWISVSKHH